jgi:hypothetical protein
VRIKDKPRLRRNEKTQEQFLMMLRRGDRFCPGSKAFLRRAAIIATYDAKLTRDLSSSVKGRDAFCSASVIAHFSTTKTTFQPDFNRGFASRLAEDAISTDRSTFAIIRGLFALFSRRKTCLQHGFGRAGLIIGCEETRFRPGSSSRIIPGTRRAII